MVTAIFDYTKRFDQIQIENLNVTENEISQANKSVPKAKKAIKQAKKNMKYFINLRKQKLLRLRQLRVLCVGKKISNR